MEKVYSFKPFYDENSEILILGTMPSVKSRNLGFYYMHPQNRFWKILETIYEEKIGENIEDKKRFLTKHHIALWDVVFSCTINLSQDSSIKNVKVNNVNKLLPKTKIQSIFTTGKKAYDLYNKYLFPKTKREAILLYSPSPANCAISFEKMVENYKSIKS